MPARFASNARRAASGDSDSAPNESQMQGTPAASAGSSRDSAAFNRIHSDQDGFITIELA